MDLEIIGTIGTLPAPREAWPAARSRRNPALGRREARRPMASSVVNRICFYLTQVGRNL